MKPTFEKIEPGFGSSFRLLHYTEPDTCWMYWHYHPEHEIVYVPRGQGKRHVGHHISTYDDGDLVFMGPNLPHLNFGYGVIGDFEEIVVQMREDFLGSDFLHRPEMEAIRRLFDRAHQGISFGGDTKRRVGAELEKLLAQPPFERLLTLLNVFQQLATSTDAVVLNAGDYSLDLNGREQERINRIYAWVDRHYADSIDIREVASLAGLTVPAFSRYFRKMTQMTFTEFVNEFRITQARKLLTTDRPVGVVAEESGFQNLSHFNKIFKQRTGLTPGAYRRGLRVTG